MVIIVRGTVMTISKEFFLLLFKFKLFPHSIGYLAEVVWN